MLARQRGCGNCGEMAAVAFDYLYVLDVRPIEYMTLDGADHSFVCIGRNASSALTRPWEWGPRAWICDAWAAGFRRNDSFGYYPATTLRTKMSSIVPLPWTPQVMLRVG